MKKKSAQSDAPLFRPASAEDWARVRTAWERMPDDSGYVSRPPRRERGSYVPAAEILAAHPAPLKADRLRRLLAREGIRHTRRRGGTRLLIHLGDWRAYRERSPAAGESAELSDRELESRIAAARRKRMDKIR